MGQKEDQATKDKTLFETIFHQYVKFTAKKKDADHWVSTWVHLKEWEKLPSVVGKISVYNSVIDETKDVLLKFFKGNLQIALSQTQVEYEDERRMNKAAWNSEFAGDFDKKERQLAHQIKMLEEILNVDKDESN